MSNSQVNSQLSTAGKGVPLARPYSVGVGGSITRIIETDFSIIPSL